LDASNSRRSSMNITAKKRHISDAQFFESL
jgi:hypothetical protein